MLSSASTWRDVAAITTRPCVALDLPGFGASAPALAARLESYADDVLAALRLLGVGRCALVGHSFGGAVATAVAARGLPVEELVLLAPGGHGDCSAGWRATVATMARFPRLVIPLFALASAVATRPATKHRPARRGGWQTLICELRLAATDAVVAVRMAAAANDAELAHGAAALACARGFRGRVTIVWGVQDGVLPLAHAHVARRALPGSRLRVLPGAGHPLHRECPEFIAALLGACSSGHRRRRAERGRGRG
jgi:pimeloyl-ACP methyl ester carboxylesterase